MLFNQLAMRLLNLSIGSMVTYLLARIFGEKTMRARAYIWWGPYVNVKYIVFG